MWYDPLRFILCFSVCCPLLSFLLINLCYWQFQVAIQAVDWFARASSIGLRCRFCEVHRRHLMHGGTQTIRFWGLQHVHWCEGSCCWFAAAKQVGLRCSQGFARSTGDVRQPGRLVSGGYPGRRLVCSRASSIGLRCRFCEVHRRHLMHGGTQTIRFWGLQHVHWCEGSCCWFLRLQSRLVWDVPKALQGRQGMCGSLAGWFQVAIVQKGWENWWCHQQKRKKGKHLRSWNTFNK